MGPRSVKEALSSALALELLVFILLNVKNEIKIIINILIILILPKADLGLTKGLQFRPLSNAAFYVFLVNFLILMQLGAKHVESPFIELGQISTVLYFAHFVLIVPVLSIIENTLDIYFNTKRKTANLGSN